MNFVPTGKIYNKIQLKYDFNNFFRRIKLKRHFIDNKQANDLNELKIKKRSTWTPKENHHSIETFIKAVNKSVESVIRGNPIKSKSNLDKRERERDALKELSERTDMLITNADKGGAAVILETKDYINEANRQLNVTSSYKKLPNDPTVTHNKLINDAIDRFKQEQLMPKETAETLKIKDPEVPKFHMLQKIQNTSTILKDRLLAL